MTHVLTLRDIQGRPQNSWAPIVQAIQLSMVVPQLILLAHITNRTYFMPIRGAHALQLGAWRVYLSYAHGACTFNMRAPFKGEREPVKTQRGPNRKKAGWHYDLRKWDLREGRRNDHEAWPEDLHDKITAIVRRGDPGPGKVTIVRLGQNNCMIK